jgi:hypothetical protein
MYYHCLQEHMTQEAKNQWEDPLAHYPPEDICDPHSADLPGPPYRSDPWKEHHSRARFLGKFFKVWILNKKSISGLTRRLSDGLTCFPVPTVSLVQTTKRCANL